MDYLYSVKASCVEPHRAVSYIDNQADVTHREIWTRAPRATARKATASGVNHIALDETDGQFFIFQISGYTKERGLYCDLLDKAGRVIETY
jgi:hypothetical protein